MVDELISQFGLSWNAFLGITICLFVGAFIQGAIGFAFGLLSIPCLVWCGIPLEQAIAMLLVVVTAQTAFSVWAYRANIVWSDILHMSFYRFVSVPIGVSLLYLMTEHFSVGRIKQVIGAAILGVVILQWLLRPQPKPKVHPVWTAVTGLASGTIAGLVGMGGPVVVLWATAHDWSTQRVRVLLWTVFLLMSPWQIAVSTWRFGDSILKAACLGAIFIPVVLFGSRLGNRFGDRLSQSRLRLVTYTILILISLVSLIEPVLHE